jgi:hypothetical protein
VNGVGIDCGPIWHFVILLSALAAMNQTLSGDVRARTYNSLSLSPRDSM